MNLPEYRQELEDAQNEFSAAVLQAGEKLRDRTRKADEAFFQEPPKGLVQDPPGMEKR